KAGWTPPRTSWGEPDLRGTYTSDNSIGVPFERPPQYGERAVLSDEEFANRDKANAEQLAKDNAEVPEVPFEKDEAGNNAPRHWLERGFKPSKATSIVIDPPDGRIPPLTPEGERRQTQLRAQRLRGDGDTYADHSNYDRCITRGVVGSILPVIYGNGSNIVQGPGYVVIRNEMIHEARLVPIDSRSPRLGKNIHMYMGDPRGHWDGSTLVVDSTNFTDRTGLGGNGNGAIHSESLHLIERYTKTAPDTMHYEFTVDDPVTYARPWTAALDLNVKPGYEIYEYACHEGNYGMRNMLSAARAEEESSKYKVESSK
ncbi:MAG TPA: hypothetical protein VGX76_19580, partial [Pirellulales bacterium]|nr:hypothetical protein [Pirellulales bacterium]